MAKFINLACSNLDSGDHNVIADALNNRHEVLDWNSPQNGQFLLKCTNSTRCNDIRDIANIYKNIRLFVSTFDPDDFSYCLRSDWCHSTDKRLESYSAEQRRQKKQEEEKAQDQDISLTDGFNQKSIILPNGTEIQINENGEVFIQEKDKNPLKVRNKSSIARNLIS